MTAPRLQSFQRFAVFLSHPDSCVISPPISAHDSDVCSGWKENPSGEGLRYAVIHIIPLEGRDYAN